MAPDRLRELFHRLATAGVVYVAVAIVLCAVLTVQPLA
jgi:hypothetical protein